MEKKQAKPSSKKVVKKAEVIILTIGEDQYDFDNIRRRTKYAPLVTIDANQLKDCKPTGNLIIDNDLLRTCKINGKHVMLSGFNKLVLDPIVTDDNKENKPHQVEVVLMSYTYLQSTLLPPKILNAEEISASAKLLRERYSVVRTK